MIKTYYKVGGIILLLTYEGRDYMDLKLDYIYQGDALEVLKTLPSESIDMCITSPPYWNMRDYGVDGQLGLEYTVNEFIESLFNIFHEIKRVLKNEGSLWINIRDTYSKGIKRSNVKNKSLCMIPERLIIKLLDDGWILRNDIIWHKPNAMPDSCKNRFTVDYEHLYFLTKIDKGYYFKTQYEPFTTKHNRDSDFNNENDKRSKLLKTKIVRHGAEGSTLNSPSKWSEQGRIKRTTWSINTKSCKEAHFATFPMDLIETPIDAGCPIRGIVLDPFMGSGTTGIVAKQQDKHYIGIELNPEYIEIANKRLGDMEK